MTDTVVASEKLREAAELLEALVDENAMDELGEDELTHWCRTAAQLQQLADKRDNPDRIEVAIDRVGHDNVAIYVDHPIKKDHVIAVYFHNAHRQGYIVQTLAGSAITWGRRVYDF